MITLRFSTILRAVIAILALAGTVGFWLSDVRHPFMDGLSFVLVQLLCLILFVACGRLSSRAPTSLLVITIIVGFVLVRAIELIFWPDWFFGYPVVTAVGFNLTLAWIVIGSTVCLASIALAGQRRDSISPHLQSINSSVTAPILAAAFIGIALFRLAAYLTLGFGGATGSGEDLGFLHRYAIRIFDPLAILIMYLVAYRATHEKSWRARSLFSGTLAIQVLYVLLTGARSGIPELVIIILSWKIVCDGDPEIAIKPFRGLLVALAIPFAALSYLAADAIRQIQWVLGDLSVTTIVAVVTNLSLEDLGYEFLKDLGYRVTLIEPTYYVVLNKQLGYYSVDDLVNVVTTGKGIVERVLPGRQFDDLLFSEYAFGFMFQEHGTLRPTTSGRVDYVGYEWGMFGISYQLFGLIGGLIFIGLLSAFLSYCVEHLRARGSFAGICLAVVFAYTTHVWVRNLGLDNLVDRTFFQVSILTFYFLMYQFLFGVPLIGRRPLVPVSSGAPPRS